MSGPSGTATLVVELVTEELPPKALKTLGTAFADTLAGELKQRGFLVDASVVTPYATPRRLAVSISHVRDTAPDAEVVDKLMPAKVARDAEGQPSEALRRKLAALGRPQLATPTLDAAEGPDRIHVASDGKADYVYLRRLASGQPLAGALQEALDAAIGRLPIPKVMRYPSRGSYYNDVEFVRPVHRLVALHGRRGGAGHGARTLRGERHRRTPLSRARRHRDRHRGRVRTGARSRRQGASALR